jgi:hypothetical protein
MDDRFAGISPPSPCCGGQMTMKITNDQNGKQQIPTVGFLPLEFGAWLLAIAVN